MPDRLTRDLLPAVLVGLGLVLGGSTSGGIWANAALQLLSLMAIGLLVLLGSVPAMPGAMRWLAAAPILLIAGQLIPLPPQLWTALPGRAEIAQQFALARLPLPWLPLALDQDAALAVLASLFAPLAMLLAMQGASPRGRARALAVVVALALGSAALGLVQWLAGNGALQPYDLTNPGMAVGLFANRNHLATLLLAAAPCAGLVVPGTLRRGWTVPVLAMLGAGVVLVGSDAGLAMLMPVMALSLICVRRLWQPGPAGKLGLMLGLALLIAGGGWAALRSQGAPLAGGPEGHRPVMIATTLTAAQDYFPAGSGAGSFQRIYPRHEDPAMASSEFRNHAHSDYAEVLLEYGLPGVLLIAGIVLWWARRSWQAWYGGPAMAEARAGAVVLGVVLVHSLVDYPLRTAAMAMLAALGAALLERAAGTAAARPDPDPEPAQEALRVSL